MLAVMDRVDARNPDSTTSAEEVSRRITEVYTHQGMTASPAVIKEEVCRFLKSPVTVEPFSFGWDRPASKEALASRRANIQTQNRWFYTRVLPAVGLGALGLGPALLALAVHFHHPVVGGVLLALTVLGSLIPGMGFENAKNERNQSLEAWYPTIQPSVEELEHWSKHPDSARYLKACLLTDCPLLRADRNILHQKVAQSETRKKQAAGQAYLARLARDASEDKTV